MGGYFDAKGNAYYYLTDYQGNVTGVIDSGAKVVQETGYYPYGEPWLEPEGDNPYLYGGKERMALGECPTDDAHIDFRTVSHIIRGVRDGNSGFGIDCANFFVVKLTISKNIPNFVKL